MHFMMRKDPKMFSLKSSKLVYMSHACPAAATWAEWGQAGLHDPRLPDISHLGCMVCMAYV